MHRIITLAMIFVLAITTVAGAESRITNATTVRLRSAASTTASVVSEMPIGTELVVLGATTVAGASWYQVKTNEGAEGWVLGSLTASLDPTHLNETVEFIVVSRLASPLNTQGATFFANVELVDLVERTAVRLNDREAQARFALYRLRAMKFAFENVPFARGTSSPYREWIDAHQDAARYDEPGGRWMVDPRYILQVHDRYRDSRMADDIAWFFVENGSFGECEGSVPCYVALQNELNGEYLRLHANGKHVDESNSQIAYALNSEMDNLLSFPAVLAEFEPTGQCKELRSSLEPLLNAVTASAAAPPRKASALRAIDRFATLCR